MVWEALIVKDIEDVVNENKLNYYYFDISSGINSALNTIEY